MKHGAWTTEEVLSAFLAGEPLKALCKRLGGSPNTIRQVLKANLGVEKFEAIRDKNDPKKSTATEAEVLTAFHTSESFKAVAARLNMSPNTLRERWSKAFGKEAFGARSERLHSAAGTRAGLSWRGKKRVSEEELQQRAQESDKTKEEKSTKRGIQFRRCPVCNIGCIGYQALTNHMSRLDDAAHVEALKVIYETEAEKRWEGKIEGTDYVVCAICGLKAESLSNHIKLHGLVSKEYQEKYDAPIRSTALREKRSRVLAESLTQNLYSKEDLLKYADAEGNIVVASVAADSGHKTSTVLTYCRRYGLQTRNRLAWQKAVLDKAAAFLGQDYIWEWTDPRIVGPESHYQLCFDGYFPKLNLIIEAHGQQHYQFSELWHGTIEEFERQRQLDTFKENKAIELGFRYKVVRFTDPIESSAYWTSLLGNSKELWSNKTEAEKQVAIETVFTVIRRHGWPETTPSVQIRAELTRLRNLKVFLDAGKVIRPYSIVGAYASGTFFPNRYYAKRKNGLNAWDLWYDDCTLKKAIRLQFDSGHPTTPERVLKAIIMFSRTPSVFRPAVAKYVYENYCPPGGYVWDPCAGYGGRLLAAVATDTNYFGTDIETATVEGNRELAVILGAKDSCRIELMDATTFHSVVPCFNLVFTSPPYYDVENYGDVFSTHIKSFRTVDKWVEEFLKVLIQTVYCTLFPKGHLVLNLPWKTVEGAHLDQCAQSIAKEVGFVECETIYMPVRSLQGNKKEPLLIWQKL